MVAKPPLAFIVEGKGEFYSYPSLVNRILNTNGGNYPVVPASGYGDIIRNIGEHLTDLCTLHEPYSIIVTIDLKDNIKDEIVGDCSELVTILNDKIKRWKKEANEDGRINSIPENIVVVIQIQTFETWLLSDREFIISEGFQINDINDWEKLDEEINLYRKLFQGKKKKPDLKNPHIAKIFSGGINIKESSRVSDSFDKFKRECSKLYQEWLENFDQCL